MIHLKQAVIVEGKYDKIKLEGLIDALILTTDGFQIFKDPEKRDWIRRLAQERGIVILTDADAAGCMIRSYLSGCVVSGEVYQAYIPEILGKEKRKARAGADGLLGVEGVPSQTILQALERAGVSPRQAPKEQVFSFFDLYQDGIVGGKDSRKRRLAFLKAAGLPSKLSTKQLLDALNAGFDEAAYRSILDGLEQLRAAR